MLRMMALLAGVLAGNWAMADQPAEPVATYSTRSGTVAPPYQWSWRAQIFADGRVTVEYCRSLGSSGPCGLATGTAPDGAVAAIATAARAADLPARPPAEDPRPPVGGGSTSAAVTLDGVTLRIPSYVLQADGARVRPVLAAIAAAIPPETVAAAQARVPRMP